jgi:hypothetical protein
MTTLSDLLTERASREARASQRQAAERSNELAILEHWPTDVPLTQVYGYPLYGAIGSVKLGSEYVPYGQPDERLTEDELLARILALPPLPRMRSKDVSTSFPLASWLMAQPENIRRKETPIYPVVLKIDGLAHHAEAVEASWYTQLGPVVAEIKATLRPMALPIRRTWRTVKRYGDTFVEDVVLRTEGSFWADQRVKWWSTAENPNGFTVYWLDPVDDTPTAAKIVDYWKDAIHPKV